MSEIMENEEIEVKQLVFELFKWQNIFYNVLCNFFSIMHCVLVNIV